MKQEEREKEMREIHVEGESRGKVRDNVFRGGGGGILRVLPPLRPLGGDPN
jgi:hypothetical protein